MTSPQSIKCLGWTLALKESSIFTRAHALTAGRILKADVYADWGRDSEKALLTLSSDGEHTPTTLSEEMLTSCCGAYDKALEDGAGNWAACCRACYRDDFDLVPYRVTWIGERHSGDILNMVRLASPTREKSTLIAIEIGRQP